MAMKTKGRFGSISKDFFYNILASVILTGVMQVVVYPFLALEFNNQEYGTLLTIMGIANTVIVAFGNTLNNVRLIVNNDYEREHLEGDFNGLLFFASLIAVVFSCMISSLYFRQSIITVIGLAVFVVLGTVRSYYCVEFRLILDFKKILIQNIVGAVGYAVGVAALMGFHIWVIPFILAELLQLIYVLKNSSLQQERITTTPVFRMTLIKYIILIFTGLSTTLITYLDRLIIYPLLGGNAVTVYTVASFFGKSLGIVMTPIAGVLLGYYAQRNFIMTKKKFWSINMIAAAGGVIFVIFSVIFSPFFTKLLYPTVFEQAAPYIFIANLAATISTVCSLTQSSVLKFAPTWLQIIKELVYGITYVGMGLVLLNAYGLLGFCIAAVAANCTKLITLYIIGTLFIGGKKNDQ